MRNPGINLVHREEIGEWTTLTLGKYEL